MFPKPLCFCGNRMTVVDTRVPWTDDHVHRRLKCRQCGFTYKTVEISLEEYRRVRHILKPLTLEINRQNHEQPETIR